MITRRTFCALLPAALLMQQAEGVYVQPTLQDFADFDLPSAPLRLCREDIQTTPVSRCVTIHYNGESVLDAVAYDVEQGWVDRYVFSATSSDHPIVRFHGHVRIGWLQDVESQRIAHEWRRGYWPTFQERVA